MRSVLITTTTILLMLASVAHADAVADAGHDYSPEVQKLFHIAVCGGAGGQDAAVARHCKALDASIVEYKKVWLDVAMPFLAGLRPAGLPSKAFYPYAGGDLVTMLAVFPEQTDFTTISLESAGDPRRIDDLKGAELDRNLEVNRHAMTRLMSAAFSATTELAASESTELPGQLIIAMLGMRVHGYEPVRLRYFTFNPDGSLHYVSDADVAAWDAPATRKKKGKKGERELRITPFSNAEITFRKAGDPRAPLKTYRHIAANLYDRFLPAGAPLLKYLASLGPIAAMTKAASHLLWNRQSSKMRTYLLGHMVWMVSDATGIPHADAVKAGFVQDTYGKYAGAYFEQRVPATEAAFVKLWASQPSRELPFRFGYFDKKFQSHLMVTRKP
jgi:hypothetical protein